LLVENIIVPEGRWVTRFLTVVVVFLFYLTFFTSSYARNPDGSYSVNPQLHAWFEGLTNRKKNPCCSMADGQSIATDDWGMEGDHYWVRLNGKKIIVPDEALVTEPNKFGPAVVWPYFGTNYDGSNNRDDIRVRCFLPGADA
jgi:hypothetical protein